MRVGEAVLFGALALSGFGLLAGLEVSIAIIAGAGIAAAAALAGFVYAIPRYLGKDRIIRQRLVIAGIGIAGIIFAAVTGLLNVYPLTFASAMTIISVAGMFAAFARMAFSAKAGYYLGTRLSSIRQRLDEYSYHSENDAVRKINKLRSVMAVIREAVFGNVFTLVFAGFIASGFVAFVSGAYFTGISLPAIIAIAAGIMIFAALAKLHPKLAFSTASATFIVGIGQSGYSQVQTYQLNEQTQALHKELNSYLENLSAERDLDEYHKQIKQALAQRQRAMQLQYVIAYNTEEEKRPEHIQNWQKQHNGEFPSYREFIQVENGQVPYVKEIQTALGLNREGKFVLPGEIVAKMEKLAKRPSEMNEEDWKELSLALGAEFMEKTKTGKRLRGIGQIGETAVLEELKQEAKDLDALAVAGGVYFGNKTGIVVLEQKGLMFIYRDGKGVIRKEDVFENKNISDELKNILVKRFNEESNKKPYVAYIILEVNKDKNIEAEARKAYKLLGRYISKKSYVDLAEKASIYKKRFDGQGNLKPNILLPKRIDFSQWLNELNTYNEKVEKIKSNKNVLREKGLSDEFIETILKEQEIKGESLSNRFKKDSGILKDLLGVKDNALEAVTLEDIEKITQKLAQEKEKAGKEMQLRKALKTLKDGPKRMGKALRNKEYRKALEKVLRMYGYSGDIDRAYLKKLMKAFKAGNFSHFINEVLKEAKSIHGLDKEIKKLEVRLKNTIGKEKEEETVRNNLASLMVSRELLKIRNREKVAPYLKEKEGSLLRIARWFKENALFFTQIKANRLQYENIEQKKNAAETAKEILSVFKNNGLDLKDAGLIEKKAYRKIKPFISQHLSAGKVKEYYLAMGAKAKHQTVAYEKNKEAGENIENLDALIKYYDIELKKIYAKEKEQWLLELKQRNLLLDRYLNVLKRDNAKIEEINRFEGMKIVVERGITTEELAAEKEKLEKGWLSEEDRKGIEKNIAELSDKLERLKAALKVKNYVLGAYAKKWFEEEKAKADANSQKENTTRDILEQITKMMGVEYIYSEVSKEEWNSNPTLLSLTVKGRLKKDDFNKLESLKEAVIKKDFGATEKWYHYFNSLILKEKSGKLAGDMHTLENQKKKTGDKKKTEEQGKKNKNNAQAMTMEDLVLEIREKKTEARVAILESRLERVKYAVEVFKDPLTPYPHAPEKVKMIFSLEKELLLRLQKILEKAVNAKKEELRKVLAEKEIKKANDEIAETLLKGDFEKAKEQIVEMLKKKYEAGIITPAEQEILIRLLKEILEKKIDERERSILKEYEQNKKTPMGEAILLIEKDIISGLRRQLNEVAALQNLLEVEKLVKQDSEIMQISDIKSEDKEFVKKIEDIIRLQELRLLYKGYHKAHQKELFELRKSLLAYIQKYPTKHQPVQLFSMPLIVSDKLLIGSYIEHKYLINLSRAPLYKDIQAITKAVDNNQVILLQAIWQTAENKRLAKVESKRYIHNQEAKGVRNVEKRIYKRLTSDYENLSDEFGRLQRALRQTFSENIRHVKHNFIGLVVSELPVNKAKRLITRENKARDEIGYLERRIKVLQNLENLYGEFSKTEKGHKRSLITLHLKLQRKILQLIDKEKESLQDNAIKSALEKLPPYTTEKLSAQKIDEIVDTLVKIEPAFRKTFNEIRRIYKTAERIEKRIKDSDKESKIKALNDSTRKEESPEKAEKEKIEIAKRIAGKVVENLGVKISIPDSAYNNFSALQKWIDENVFMGMLKGSNIYELLMKLLAEVYGVTLLTFNQEGNRAMRLAKVEIKDMESLESVGKTDKKSLSSLTITLGYSGQEGMGGINFGGVIDEFFRDLKDFIEHDKDITSIDLDKLREKLNRVIMGDLRKVEEARVLVLATSENLKKIEKAKGTKTFAYLEAWNNYVRAQERFRSIFGYYVKRESLTDKEVRKIILQDFSKARRQIRESIRRVLKGKYGIEDEKKTGLLSSLFFNIGLNYNSGSFTLGFVVGATLFNGSKKLNNLLLKLREEARKQRLEAEKDNLTDLRKYFEGVYGNVNEDALRRYRAFYLKLMYGQEFMNMASFDEESLVKLLNEKVPGEDKKEKVKSKKQIKEEQQKAAEMAKEKRNNERKQEEDVRKAAEERINKFDLEIDAAIKYIPVKSDMTLQEILQIAKQNRELLKAQDEEFDKFVKESLWSVLSKNTESSEYYIKELARFINEHTSIALKETSRWAEKRLKGIIEPLKIKQFKASLADRRLRYLRERQNDLLIEQIKLIEERREASHKVKDIQGKKAAIEKELPELKKELVDEKNKEKNILAVEEKELNEQITEVDTKLGAIKKRNKDTDKELMSLRNRLVFKEKKEIKELNKKSQGTNDNVKFKDAIEKAEERKTSLKSVVTSRGKLEQAKDSQKEKYEKLWEDFGGRKQFTEDMNELQNQEAKTARRRELETKITSFLASLIEKSILLDEVMNDIGKNGSPEWIHKKMEAVLEASRETEDKRQEQKRGYYYQRDVLLLELLTGDKKKNKAKKDKEKDTQKEKAYEISVKRWEGLLKDKKNYLEEEELKKEEQFKLYWKDNAQKNEFLDWSKLNNKSPPDELQVPNELKDKYLKQNSQDKQQEALINFLNTALPTQDTKLNASIINFLFGIVKYSKSAKAVDKKGFYSDFLYDYLQALYLYAGDIFSHAEKNGVLTVLGITLEGENAKAFKELLKIKEKIEKDKEAIKPGNTNLILINEAIKNILNREDKNDIEPLKRLEKIEKAYLLEYTKAILKAKYTYLQFLRTNPKDRNWAVASNFIVTGILLLSNLLSNYLPNKEIKDERRKVAGEILGIIKEIANVERQVEQAGGSKKPEVKDEIYIGKNGGVFIRSIITEEGKVRYEYRSTDEYYEELRQREIYRDGSLAISDTSPNMDISRQSPLDTTERSFGYTLTDATRLDLGELYDGDLGMDVIYNAFFQSRSLKESFGDAPDEQRITFNLGRMGLTNQNIQLTYIETKEGEHRVLFAASHGWDGNVVTTMIEFDEKGKAHVIVGGRKTYEIAGNRGSVGLFVGDQAVSFFFNQRISEWEVRWRSDYDFEESGVRFNFETLKHSSIGQMAAGFGVTYDTSRDSVVPYFVMQTRGLGGNGIIRGSLGWDINNNEPVFQLMMQNTAGMINPYVGMDSNGDTSNLNVGARAYDAHDRYVDAGVIGSSEHQGGKLEFGNGLMSAGGQFTTGNNSNLSLNFTPLNWRQNRRQQPEELISENTQPTGSILFDSRMDSVRDVLDEVIKQTTHGARPGFWASFKGLFSDGINSELEGKLSSLGMDIDKKEEKEPTTYFG